MEGRKPIKFLRKGGCHICFSHGCNPDGYPCIKISGKTYRIHRLVYEQAKGPIPRGLVIRHECDNPKCINPNHLTLGTHSQNVEDRVARGQSAAGEQNGRSKLTAEQAREIFLSGEKTEDLAKRFGISRRAVWQIKNRITWKTVNGEPP